MTTSPESSGAERPARQGGVASVRSIMKWTIISGALIAVAIGTIASFVGALLTGLPGVWGALIGAVVAFAFFAITAVVMYFTAESSPTTMAAGVLGGFLVKIVGFMGVGIALRGRDFYDPWTLFLTLAVAAIASLIADVVIVQRARLPFVDESAR
ncbi:MAG: hypothetical protein ACTHVY_08135 [Brevibacterium yomogidense]|uniref:ATP synthase protein I n=1 Tax=Brevibacterium yomogidense TaxID=946573 RepID=A0A1X6XMB8_9MICO|nr:MULTISPECIES: hypothetical protein [Brevibacterium]SLN00283.1 ATP synthase protein I [Brevibacterium yomogidense]SMX74913.1 hypothetical protein BSP109_01138 [Brevibacterium sp. Mu109]